LELAQEYFDCTICLCPDMAFAMDSARIDRFKASPVVSALYLSRMDKEAAKNRKGKYPKRLRIVDWAGKYKLKYSRYYRVLDKIERHKTARRCFPVYRLRLLLSERMAMERLAMGCRMLCQAETIVTDRLHGMILASMLGLRVCAFNNSYGKLSAYYETWREWLPNVVFCRDEAEAIDAALS